MNKRASADNAPVADLTLRHNDCPDPHERPYPNMDITAEVDARSNMGMIADDVVVIDRTCGIENDIIANNTPGTDNDTGTDHHAVTNLHIRCDHSGWVPGGRKALAPPLVLLKQALAILIITDPQDERVMVDLA